MGQVFPSNTWVLHIFTMETCKDRVRVETRLVSDSESSSNNRMGSLNRACSRSYLRNQRIAEMETAGGRSLWNLVICMQLEMIVKLCGQAASLLRSNEDC